jgi:hypothetical protein
MNPSPERPASIGGTIGRLHDERARGGSTRAPGFSTLARQSATRRDTFSIFARHGATRRDTFSIFARHGATLFNRRAPAHGTHSRAGLGPHGAGARLHRPRKLRFLARSRRCSVGVIAGQRLRFFAGSEWRVRAPGEAAKSEVSSRRASATRCLYVNVTRNIDVTSFRKVFLGKKRETRVVFRRQNVTCRATVSGLPVESARTSCRTPSRQASFFC